MERERRQTDRTWTGSWVAVIDKAQGFIGWKWVAEWDRTEARETQAQAQEQTPPDPQGGGA